MTHRTAYLISGVLLVALVSACGPSTQPAPPPVKTEAKPAAPEKPVAQAPATKPAEPAAKPAEAAKPATAPAATAPKVDTKAIEDFYTGKTMRIIVGSAAGGGYDAYARMVSRHLGRQIPGSPNIIVENMEGAGSLRAANHVYKAAAKDGTIVGHIQGGLFVQQILGQGGIEFDALKWKVLGIPAVERPLCVATAKSGLKTMSDVMNPGGKQYVVGGNAPGSATWDVSMRLKYALDLNLKMVDGYDGTAKIRLAMDSGEVDGICGWGYESVRATAWDRIESGEYVVITQVSEEPLQGLEKAPLIMQFPKTEEAKQLIRLGSIVPGKIIRPFLVAPEVPADRVQMLKQAFDAMWRDKEFLADAEKTKLEISPISGDEAEKAIRDLFAMPEDVKTKLQLINEKKL